MKTAVPSPDGSEKPFEIKCPFSWTKRATSGSSFLSLEKGQFYEKACSVQQEIAPKPMDYLLLIML